VRPQSGIFLETSIQIERFVRPDREPVILSNLFGKELQTSCYVLAEFRRTLLRDLRFVSSVIEDNWGENGEHPLTLDQLLQVLSRVRNVRSERRYQRFLWIAATLLECFGADPVPAADVIDWLAELILTYNRELLSIDFHDSRGQAEVLYQCQHDCDLAQDGRDLSHMTCRGDEARCSLPRFLAAHEPQLRALLSAHRQAPASMRDDRALAALERVLSDPTFESAKGQRNCWPLGDTIMTLEAPDGVPIYTLDHHYDLICTALGKTRYTEQPLP
jgi:hypothetical protein